MAGDKSFLETMKPFHDKYASPTTLFAIGETGLGRGADMQARLDWLIDATSVETTSQMKYYVALSWVSPPYSCLPSSAFPSSFRGPLLDFLFVVLLSILPSPPQRVEDGH